MGAKKVAYEPAGVVKKGEEPQWDKAKRAAGKYFKKDSDSLSGDDYALVNWLFHRFVGRDSAEAKKPSDLDEAALEEALGAAANGALMRPSKIKKECKEQSFKIFEKEQDAKGRSFYPCIIIAEGMGNLKDKNYYTPDAIKSGEAVYEGKKAYFDHPTPDDERQRPGRSVREIAGHYEDVKAQKIDGGTALKAKLVPVSSNEAVISLLEHAVEYKKKYPDKDFIGISINGDGEGSTLEYDEFLKECKPSKEDLEKLSQIKGQPINVITKLTDAVSADLVTEAGAKGQILKEQKKPNKHKENKMRFIESMRELLFGAERGDQKLMEKAVKDMLQDEGDDKKSADKDGDKDSQEADTLVKHLLQTKKEMKKKEDESEEEYEARCMKQAMKQMKAESEKKKEDGEDEKKEKKHSKKHEDEDEKKEKKHEDGKGAAKKDDDGDADDKHEKKEADDSASKDKKDAGKDDDEGHADKAQDVALIKKMMKQVEKLQAEMDEMKKEKKEAEKEAKDAKESAAKANIELETRKRIETVDKVLRESSLPYYVTNKIRPVIEKCKTEKEMKALVSDLAEAHTRVIEEQFVGFSSRGFVERQENGEDTSTDSLFLKGDK